MASMTAFQADGTGSNPVARSNVRYVYKAFVAVAITYDSVLIREVLLLKFQRGWYVGHVEMPEDRDSFCSNTANKFHCGESVGSPGVS